MSTSALLMSTSAVSQVSNVSPNVPRQLELSLDPALSSVHVVHTCCNYQTWKKPPTKVRNLLVHLTSLFPLNSLAHSPHQTSSSVKVVTMTNLSATFVTGANTITAFVTSSTPGRGGVVEAATVRLFNSHYVVRDVYTFHT